MPCPLSVRCIHDGSCLSMFSAAHVIQKCSLARTLWLTPSLCGMQPAVSMPVLTCRTYQQAMRPWRACARRWSLRCSTSWRRMPSCRLPLAPSHLCPSASSSREAPGCPSVQTALDAAALPLSAQCHVLLPQEGLFCRHALTLSCASVRGAGSREGSPTVRTGSGMVKRRAADAAQPADSGEDSAGSDVGYCTAPDEADSADVLAAELPDVDQVHMTATGRQCKQACSMVLVDASKHTDNQANRHDVVSFYHLCPL